MLGIVDKRSNERVADFSSDDRAKCIAKTSRLNKGLPAKPFTWKAFSICVATCTIGDVAFTSAEQPGITAAYDDLRRQIRTHMAATVPARFAELEAGGYWDALHFADFSERCVVR